MATRPLRIGLLLYPHCMPAGLLAFADMVHAANRRAGRDLFQTRFVASRPDFIASAHGMSLKATGALRDRDLDAVLVPGFWAESPQQAVDALVKSSDVVAGLAGLPGTTAIWGYCTGVCLLAAAGKLNGRRATVTWWLADTMRQRHRKVRWQSEQTCIVNLRNATASGVNGYLPIAQAVIEKYLSRDAFRDLTKLMVLPRPEQIHIAFQTLSLVEQSDSVLRKLHAMVIDLPAAEITVQVLSAKLNTSTRTLARRVKLLTGCTVAAYVRRIKLNQAGERLIMTSASASTISAELGFSSDATMRRMFKDLTALTPLEYRQMFGRG